MNLASTVTFKVTVLALAIAAPLGYVSEALAQADNKEVEEPSQVELDQYPDQNDAALDTVNDDAVLETVDVITVTASRRQETLQDVAMAVTTIDTNDYVDAGQTTLTDILSFVPGVTTSNNGRPALNNVFIRGIAAELSAGVASYIDEIPFGSSTVYANSAPLDGTLLDLGTMDVLKGPQGTLYGASALGGILQFNTRTPSLQDRSGSVSANLSDTRRGGFNQLYRANFNGRLIKDTLGASLTVYHQENNGFVDNVVLDVDDWDDYENYGGSGSLRWAVTDRLEVTLQGLHQKIEQDGRSLVQANFAKDMPIEGVGAAEPIFGRFATGQTSLEPSEYEVTVGGLTIKYDFGFGKLTSATGIQDMSFEQSIDVTIPFASFADLFFPDTAPHTSAINEGNLGFEKITQELRLTSDSNESFEWIVGMFYTDEDGFNSQETVVTPRVPLFKAGFPSNYEEISAFATGTWYFTPDFDVSVGLRQTHYSNDVVLNAEGPLLAPLPFSEFDDDVTNFLVNLRYRPSGNTSIYSRVASGFRPGGANFVLLDPETGNPLSDQQFDPDELVSYEVGVKGTLGDGRLTYDLAGFYIDWEDFQIGIVRNGLQVVGNASEAVSRGVEASFGLAVTDALTLTGSLAYINAELRADEPDLGGADGDQLPATPEWEATLGADYGFSVFGWPAHVGASYRYKGEMPVGFEGFTDDSITDSPPSGPRGVVMVDSFSLVDLRAGVSIRDFDVSMYVTNVFDEWAWTSFSPSLSITPTGAPTRPRTIGGVVRWHF